MLDYLAAILGYLAGLLVIVIAHRLPLFIPHRSSCDSQASKGEKQPLVASLLERAAERPKRPLVNKDERKGGASIGLAETVLIYSALWYGEQAGLIIAGYLAFKVASKWGVWEHVYRIPDGAEDSETRSEWGHYLFTRFVLGTVLNLLLAMLAASLKISLDPVMAIAIGLAWLLWHVIYV